MGNLEESGYFIRLLKTSSMYYTGDKSIRKSILRGQEYLKVHLDEAMNTPLNILNACGSLGELNW
ncbi:5753_t:CDS:2 [Funneliformis geosporum]|nr:5753_t:CDS:2 [Funneliformis geosporum]